MTQLVAGHLNIQHDTIPELNPSYRLLLGPGQCNVDPRILRIASAPQLGHTDPGQGHQQRHAVVGGDRAE